METEIGLCSSAVELFPAGIPKRPRRNYIATGLAIGACRHEPQRCAATHSAVVQEGADRGVPLVLVRLGRHRQPGVVGQQGDHAVDVARLEGVSEAAHDLALALGVRRRRPFTSGRGQAGLERAACAAQQLASHAAAQRAGLVASDVIEALPDVLARD